MTVLIKRHQRAHSPFPSPTLPPSVSQEMSLYQTRSSATTWSQTSNLQTLKKINLSCLSLSLWDFVIVSPSRLASP